MTVEPVQLSNRGRRPGRVPTVALVVAVGWGLVLFLAAFTSPLYDSESASSSSDGSTSGEVIVSSATAVEVNGWGIAIVFGFPLVIALAVAVALWFRAHRAALPIAWTLTGILALGNLLALLSIGVFALPVTVALVVACSTSAAVPRELPAAPVPTTG